MYTSRKIIQNVYLKVKVRTKISCTFRIKPGLNITISNTHLAIPIRSTSYFLLKSLAVGIKALYNASLFCEKKFGDPIKKKNVKVLVLKKVLANVAKIKR